MTKIYIVRHGETDWNRAGKLQGATDVPLNEEVYYFKAQFLT